MRQLYVLSFPCIQSSLNLDIDEFRSTNDPNASVVRAHFTLVFGSSSLDETTYFDHVASVAGQNKHIHFKCRYAMLGADDQDQSAYVFLVPDEGNSGVSLLHDRLYTGPLAPLQRLDLPFTPHITIGRMQDRVRAKALCDELNASQLQVTGSIENLCICAREGRNVVTLKEFPLAA